MSRQSPVSLLRIQNRKLQCFFIRTKKEKKCEWSLLFQYLSLEAVAGRFCSGLTGVKCLPSDWNVKNSPPFPIRHFNCHSLFIQASGTQTHRARTRPGGPGFQYRGWSWESSWRPANLRQNCLPNWRCGPRRPTEAR